MSLRGKMMYNVNLTPPLKSKVSTGGVLGVPWSWSICSGEGHQVLLGHGQHEPVLPRACPQRLLSPAGQGWGIPFQPSSLPVHLHRKEKVRGPKMVPHAPLVQTQTEIWPWGYRVPLALSAFGPITGSYGPQRLNSKSLQGIPVRVAGSHGPGRRVGSCQPHHSGTQPYHSLSFSRHFWLLAVPGFAKHNWGDQTTDPETAAILQCLTMSP